jgi:hypothetical protein
MTKIKSNAMKTWKRRCMGRILQRKNKCFTMFV